MLDSVEMVCNMPSTSCCKGTCRCKKCDTLAHDTRHHVSIPIVCDAHASVHSAQPDGHPSDGDTGIYLYPTNCTRYMTSWLCKI